MSEPLSPRQVVETLMQRISDSAWQGLDELYADKATLEYPFALPTPMRLDGREAIRKYFAAVATAPMKLQARNMVVRETTDAEVVVAEWHYDGVVTTTGRTFGVANVQVSTVRDGKIVASRDYHNHVVLADVTGQLPSLLAMLTETNQR